MEILVAPKLKKYKKIGLAFGGGGARGFALIGVVKALEEEGLTLLDDYVYVGKYDLESGRKGAEKLLNTDVTAIFAFSDIQAYGVIDYVKSKNLTIPKDLSLIGFDDIFYSSLLDVPLTTMRQPIKELAHDASNAIVKMIKGDGEVINEQKDKRLTAELVKRKSVKRIN